MGPGANPTPPPAATATSTASPGTSSNGNVSSPVTAVPAGSPAATANSTSNSSGPGIVPTIAKKSKGGRKAANPTMSDEERRQERVLKNRVSAMKSLQKKKRYTDDLEKRAKLLTAQNIDLKSRIYTLVAKLNPAAIHAHNNGHAHGHSPYDTLLQSLLVQQQQQQHHAYAYHNNHANGHGNGNGNMPNNIPAAVQHQSHQQIIDAQHRQALAAAQRQAVINSQLFSAPGMNANAANAGAGNGNTTAISTDSLPTSPLLLDDDSANMNMMEPAEAPADNPVQVQVKKEEAEELEHIPADSFDTLTLPTVPPAPPDVPDVAGGLVEAGEYNLSNLNNLSMGLDVDIGNSFLNVAADGTPCDLSLLDDGIMQFDTVSTV